METKKMIFNSFTFSFKKCFIMLLQMRLIRKNNAHSVFEN